MTSFWHVQQSWDIIWIQDIFYKIQAVIHAHNETLVQTCYYTTAELASLNVFPVQRRPVVLYRYIKWSTKHSDVIFARTNVTTAK